MATDTATNSESSQRPLAVDSESELDDLVASDEVVLVDFYADWCGPCKMIEPVVERLAEETDVTVAKVDVDVNQQLASAYGVRGVPTLVLFADGSQVEEIVGVTPEGELRSLVESYT